MYLWVYVFWVFLWCVCVILDCYLIEVSIWGGLSWGKIFVVGVWLSGECGLVV